MPCYTSKLPYRTKDKLAESFDYTTDDPCLRKLAEKVALKPHLKPLTRGFKGHTQAFDKEWIKTTDDGVIKHVHIVMKYLVDLYKLRNPGSPWADLLSLLRQPRFAKLELQDAAAV